MTEAFTIGDGVPVFASIGAVVHFANTQAGYKKLLTTSELYDRLMKDLGPSDTSESDEEEWFPNVRRAQIEKQEWRPKSQYNAKGGERVPNLKPTAWEDKVKDWPPKSDTKDSDEEERAPGALRDTSASDEEEWTAVVTPLTSAQDRLKEPYKVSGLNNRLMKDLSLYDAAESDEEEWCPQSLCGRKRGVEKESDPISNLAPWESKEKNWYPKYRFDTQDSDEEEWTPDAPRNLSESDEEEWIPESQIGVVVDTAPSALTKGGWSRRITQQWRPHPVDNLASSAEYSRTGGIKLRGGDSSCIYPGCNLPVKLKGRCETHGVKCSKLSCRKFVLRKGKCFTHCRLNICSVFECYNSVRDSATCFEHSNSRHPTIGRGMSGTKESCVSNVSPVKPLAMLDTAKTKSRKLAQKKTDSSDIIRGLVEVSSDEADDHMATKKNKSSHRACKGCYNVCSQQRCYAVARLNGRCIRHGGAKLCSQFGCTR
ncbi:unnamed protein product [Phytophthora fragariaefolia]|uniref:Unnamed protein product n=1 Tax=Phytophthora fragariaefolia TaxID=1490495 RepID=A0A9W6WZ57_9STRA|nr:unnamed protein product [Phytophthora fragariaefolia]